VPWKLRSVRPELVEGLSCSLRRKKRQGFDWLSPNGVLVTENNPILFFDSGVGGLSVLAPTRALLPNAPIVYAADNAAFPYGTKTEAEIAERVPALLVRLVERFRPRLVVVACNTASTIALDHARAALDIPVVGTVPAIKPAAEMSKSRVIGVLGTAATVRQPYVDDLAARFAADCTIVRHGSAELVALAEAKLAGKAIRADAVAAAVQPLRDAPGLDTVVLACTHFPLLADELAEALPNVRFVDGGPGIARRIAWLTRGQDWPDEPPPGIALFTGAPPPPPPALIAALAEHGLTELEML
jgi:glutamate racemase